MNKSSVNVKSDKRFCYLCRLSVFCYPTSTANWNHCRQ